MVDIIEAGLLWSFAIVGIFQIVRWLCQQCDALYSRYVIREQEAAERRDRALRAYTYELLHALGDEAVNRMRGRDTGNLSLEAFMGFALDVAAQVSGRVVGPYYKDSYGEPWERKE